MLVPPRDRFSAALQLPLSISFTEKESSIGCSHLLAAPTASRFSILARTTFATIDITRRNKASRQLLDFNHSFDRSGREAGMFPSDFDALSHRSRFWIRVFFLHLFSITSRIVKTSAS